MHMHTNTCIDIYKHTNMHIYAIMHTNLHTYEHTYISSCIQIAYMCIHKTYFYTCIYSHACTIACMHADTHYAYTSINTYKHASSIHLYIICIHACIHT